jgi:hypothetical protein
MFKIAIGFLIGAAVGRAVLGAVADSLDNLVFGQRDTK